MKKLFLKSMALLLVAVMAISAFASCEETGKQDNDGEKPSGNEGASDDNEIGTEGLAYALLDNNTYAVSVGSAKEATEIVIPSKYNGKPVTSIAFEAFRDCTRLTSIDIPDSVTNIGDYAFRDCTRLTSIDIPDSVKSIGYGAFYDCIELTSIDIPDSVKSISFVAFSGCTNLTSIDIPDSVTSIGASAFYNCTELTSITIPFVGPTLNETGDAHFGYIFGASSYSDHAKYIPASLKTVVITGGTSIGDHAFSGCDGLTSIEIPNSVTSIGDSAFYGCTGLTSIEIPNSVTSIGEGPFDYCTGLKSISVEENNDTYKSIDGNLYSKDGKTLVQYAIGKTDASFAIPNGVESIGDSAFSGCSGLTSIDIPDSVKSIGYAAFYDCIELTSIDIPDSVTSIGEFAFSRTAYYNNESNWENGVLYIGKYLIGAKKISGDYSVKEGTKIIAFGAFSYCYGLESIYIPNSVKGIDDAAFHWCLGLTSIKFRGSEAEWNAIEKGSGWNEDVPSSCQIIFNYTGE